MAIIIHPNIKQLYATVMASLFAAPSSITIYSGAQPTAPQIIAAWPSYNTTNASFLLHYQSVTWGVPTGLTSIGVTTFPPATLPTNTGVASWAILWMTSIAVGTMGTGTLPNLNFVVVPVSSAGGTGVVKFSDTAITTGTAVSLYDASYSVM